jgi:hypothetical protein
MADPRDNFLSRIDLAKTRVRAFEGFVFLCGGPRANDPVPIKSIRHMLYHELTSGRHGDIVGRLKLAEEIQDWFRDGNYLDLIAFEADLAGLSAVIVLVAESPGALAELGVFSTNEAFADRLLVLVAEIHYDAESFIKLGPFRRLENNFEGSVLVYNWHQKSIEGRVTEQFEMVAGHLDAIVESIRTFTSPSKSERLFKPSESSHVMLLVCELCDLFGALPQMEIAKFLKNIGLAVAPIDLKRYLFLLEKCDLLRIKASGNGRYYHSLDWRSRISFGFTTGDMINRERLRVDVAEFYQKELPSRYDVVRALGRA